MLSQVHVCPACLDDSLLAPVGILRCSKAFPNVLHSFIEARSRGGPSTPSVLLRTVHVHVSEFHGTAPVLGAAAAPGDVVCSTRMTYAAPQINLREAECARGGVACSCEFALRIWRYRVPSIAAGAGLHRPPGPALQGPWHGSAAACRVPGVPRGGGLPGAHPRAPRRATGGRHGAPFQAVPRRSAHLQLPLLPLPRRRPRRHSLQGAHSHGQVPSTPSEVMSGVPHTRRCCPSRCSFVPVSSDAHLQQVGHFRSQHAAALFAACTVMRVHVRAEHHQVRCWRRPDGS